MFIGFLMVLFCILAILNFLCAIFIIFFERKTPAVTWAWLMLLTFTPVIGILVYLTFGFDGRKTTHFLKKNKNDEQIFSEYYENEAMPKKQLVPSAFKYADSIIKMNFVSAKSILRTDTKIDIFTDGIQKFESMLEDIRNAKSFIHMEYYIIRSDKLGKKIVQALAQKARDGVEVRLLYDGIGNIRNSKTFFNELKNAGGKIGIFLPPYFIRINYRNHRKLCIIDGKVGYIGGLNIGDEYIGMVKRFGFWRDTHLKISGSCLYDLNLRFIADWNFTSKERLSILPKYFPKDFPSGNKLVQIVSSGPDCKFDNILNAYFKMISEAKKSIYVQTPYFVPNDSILEALRTAALSGVTVKIMIPAKPDHPFVYGASLSYLGELLEVGVKCYKYTKGFIHSKVITVDSKMCSVGTANMDIRSFRINFESNTFIYDEEITSTLEKSFNNDLSVSDEITLEYYNSLPKTVRIKEAISRLISPML